MQSSALAELNRAKRGLSIKEITDLDPDPISNLKFLRIDALGEISRISGVPREFPLYPEVPLDEGKATEDRSSTGSSSSLSPQQTKMVSFLKKLLVTAADFVKLLQGKPVDKSQGESCVKMREKFEKEMKRLQELPRIELSPSETEELDDLYGDIEESMQELSNLADLAPPEEAGSQTSGSTNGFAKPHTFLKVDAIKARRLTPVSTDYLSWRQETRKLLSVINYSPEQSVFFLYDAA